MNHAQPGDTLAARTHIAIVLDRSGSMDSIRDDVVGGFNAFLTSQQAVEGEATLTLVQFDSQDPYEVLFDHAPLDAVRALGPQDFVPRGCTPLLDAVGRTLLATELWLAQQSADTRPEQTIFVVITDGQENASREFNLARVRSLIQAKEALGWQVVFLSADLGAFNEAGDLGIAEAKRVMFSKDADGNREMFQRTSLKVAAMRRREVNDIGYDDADRDAMGGKPVN